MDEGAESDAEIVMGTTIEIDLVADIEAQPKRTDAAFETATGIENATDVLRAEIINGTEEGVKGCWARVKAGIEEAALDGDKRMQGAVTEVDFGAEKTVEEADVGALNGNGAGEGIGEALVEDLIEIVIDFAFDLDERQDGDSEASADTREIRVGLGEMEIVNVGSELSLSGGAGHEQNREDKDEQERKTVHASLRGSGINRA
jgi:hypothetical protein